MTILQKRILAEKNELGYVTAILEDINFHSFNSQVEQILAFRTLDKVMQEEYKKIDHDLLVKYTSSVGWSLEPKFILRLLKSRVDAQSFHAIKVILDNL